MTNVDCLSGESIACSMREEERLVVGGVVRLDCRGRLRNVYCHAIFDNNLSPGCDDH